MRNMEPVIVLRVSWATALPPKAAMGMGERKVYRCRADHDALHDDGKCHAAVFGEECGLDMYEYRIVTLPSTQLARLVPVTPVPVRPEGGEVNEH